jgi:hypothetical protein
MLHTSACSFPTLFWIVSSGALGGRLALEDSFLVCCFASVK